MGLSLVFPVHDSTGTTLARLERLWPVLETVVERVYVGITSTTQAHCSDEVATLTRNPLVETIVLPEAAQIGDQFRALYRTAARLADADQVMHLCFTDRLAFAIESPHRDRFLADIALTADGRDPLILARSAYAWATHPKNYREIEGFVTTVGELLFHRQLDFAWCHMVLRAHLLAEITELVHNHDLSMVSEMVLAVRDRVEMKAVDWLEWEDPWELGRDADELRHEREASIAETQKRLGYAVPMVETLMRAAGGACGAR